MSLVYVYIMVFLRCSETGEPTASMTPLTALEINEI
jgi:hypothetical protein